MFFTDKNKELIAELHHKVEFFKVDIQKLQHRLEIQTTRLDALMKLYPNGINKDGQPRKRPGRPRKVKA